MDHIGGEAAHIHNPTELDEAGWERLEDKAYDEQERLIEERYGKVEANYGWGTDSREDREIIETKIYRSPRTILRTTYFPDGCMEHSWYEGN